MNESLETDGTPPSRVRLDLVFRASGGPIPIDHGHLLFGALGEILGDLHDAGWLTVFPVLGLARSDGTLEPGRRRGALRLRVDLAEVPRALNLAGKDLRVGEGRLLLGTSTIAPLEPCPALTSRIVVIKGFVEEAPFREAVQRKLQALGVTCEVAELRRRIVHIHGKRVVGFGVTLRGLSEADSVRVQAEGIGGRQRFGCGGFLPLRRDA